MVLDIASAVLTNRITTSRIFKVLAPLGVAIGLRRWSAGYVCLQERNITDKTFIMVGACSGPGLELLRHLATRGAQVVVLHPTPADPAIFQLILLLRETTGNERIYADECDVMTVESVQAFAKRWGSDARKGMLSDLEATIEGLIFCDGDGSGLDGVGIGVGKRHAPGSTSVELHHASLVLARHSLIQFLLPFIIRSSITSPVRIIFQLSPFYSASSSPLLPSPSAVLDFTPPFTYPKWSPWLADGQASLASLALLRELQLRVNRGRKTDAAGIICLAACGGFTRAWFRRTLRASQGHENSSWIGFLVYIILLPFITLFAKSANEAAQDLLLTVLGSVTPEAPGPHPSPEDVGKKVARPASKQKQLRPGALYREGEEIRVVVLEKTGPTLGPSLWQSESKKVEELVMAAVASKEREKKKAPVASPASPASKPEKID